MRAVGFRRSLPIRDKDSLIDFELPMPTPHGRELLVRVAAAAVNPVDTKRRQFAAKDIVSDPPVILGFDAVGRVEEVGDAVEHYAVGDLIWYAGSIDRQGCNAEFQCVDERMVGRCPKDLSVTDAVSLPLTGLTAWEALFDRMHVDKTAQPGDALLIIGGAGGVGSIATQIARRVSGMTVIATASREETKKWCRNCGANEVADHRDLPASLRELGIKEVPYILNCADTDGYWDAMMDSIAPEGTICSIVGPRAPLNMMPMMTKSATFAWEMMSTRPMFETRALARQRDILNLMADLVEDGTLQPTTNETMEGLSATILKQAHARLESGTMIGKLAVRY